MNISVVQKFFSVDHQSIFPQKGNLSFRQKKREVVTHTVRAVSPKGFQAAISKHHKNLSSNQGLSSKNTPELDIMVRLPPNVTPDSVVISMFLDSVESKHNSNANCSRHSIDQSTSEKSIKLECSEDNEAVTVFEGNVVFSSDMDITSLAKVPLVVFSDKTIKNIKTDVHTTTLNGLTLNEILLQQSFSNLTQDQFKSNQIKIDKVTEITHHLKVSSNYIKNYFFTINSVDLKQPTIMSLLPKATNNFQLLPYNLMKSSRILQFLGPTPLIYFHDDILQFPSIFNIFNQRSTLLNNFKLDKVSWNLQPILIDTLSKCQEIQKLNMVLWNIFVLFKLSTENFNLILHEQQNEKGKFYNFLLKLFMFWLNTGQKLKQNFIEPNRTKALFDFIQCKFQCVHSVLSIPMLEDTDENFQKENFDQNTKISEELEKNITAVQYAKADDILSRHSKETCTIIEENFERNINVNNPPIKNKSEYSYLIPKFGYYFNHKKYSSLFENYDVSVQFTNFGKFVQRVKDNKNSDKSNEQNSDVDGDDQESGIPSENIKNKKLKSQCIGSPISYKLCQILPSSSSSSHHYVPQNLNEPNQSKTLTDRNLHLRRTNPMKNFYDKNSSIHHQKCERAPFLEIVRKTHAKYRQEYRRHMKIKNEQSLRKTHKRVPYETDNSHISLSMKVNKMCPHHRKRQTLTKPSIGSIGDSDFITTIDYTQMSEPHSSKSFVDYTLEFSTPSTLDTNSVEATSSTKRNPKITDSKMEILNKLIYICSDEEGPLFSDKDGKPKRTRIKVMTSADRDAYERLKKINLRQLQGSTMPFAVTQRFDNIYEKSMGSKALRTVTQEYKTLKDKNLKSSSSKSKKSKNGNGNVIKKKCTRHGNVEMDHSPIFKALVLKDEFTQDSEISDNNSNKGTKIALSKFSQTFTASSNSLFSIKDSYSCFNMNSMSLIFDTYNNRNTYFPIIQSKIVIFNHENSLLDITNNLLKLNDSTVASVYFNHQMYNISEELAHKCLKNYLRRKCGKYLYRRKYRKNRKYYLLYK